MEGVLSPLVSVWSGPMRSPYRRLETERIGKSESLLPWMVPGKVTSGWRCPSTADCSPSGSQLQDSLLESRNCSPSLFLLIWKEQPIVPSPGYTNTALCDSTHTSLKNSCVNKLLRMIPAEYVICFLLRLSDVST